MEDFDRDEHDKLRRAIQMSFLNISVSIEDQVKEEMVEL
jgi:hypothetical protein